MSRSSSNPFALHPSTTDHSRVTYLRNWKDRLHELYLNRLIALLDHNLAMGAVFPQWVHMDDRQRSDRDSTYARLLYEERRALDTFLAAVVSLQVHLTQIKTDCS